MHNKVSRISIYLLLISALFLQLVALDYIKIFATKPDLMLLLVIFYGLFFGSSIGIETGFIAGLLKDILSVDIFGINTLTLAATGLAAGILSSKFSKESRATQTVLVFSFSIFSMLMHYIYSSFISNITYINLSEYVLRLMIPVSLYTSLVSMIIFPVLMTKYHLEEREEFL